MYQNSDKEIVKCFQGTGISDFILHLLSCLKMLNNWHDISWNTWNDDLVQYYEMIMFKNITTYTYIFEVDEFQNITNKFKQILKL